MDEIECIEVRFCFVSGTGEFDSYCVGVNGVMEITEDEGEAAIYYIGGEVEFVYNVHHAIYKKGQG